MKQRAPNAAAFSMPKKIMIDNDQEVFMTGENINEGVYLALGAISETLESLTGYLLKQEEREIAKSEEELQKSTEIQKQEEFESIVKAVVEQLAVAKSAADQGIDVGGDKNDPVGGKDQWPMSGQKAAEDSEENKQEALNNPTATAQAPITASTDGPDLTSEVAKYDEKIAKGDDKDDAEEYPKEEEGPDKDLMKSLTQTVAALSKQIEDIQVNKEMEIKKSTQEALHKLGYREERSVAPAVSGVVTGDIQIAKSAPAADVTDILANIPYQQLRRWEQQAKSGNTDGIPQELLGQF